MQQGTASLRSQSLSQCEIAHQSLNSAEVHRTASWAPPRSHTAAAENGSLQLQLPTQRLLKL